MVWQNTHVDVTVLHLYCEHLMVLFTKHGSFMHPLNHTLVELEPEVKAEQAQVEPSTNQALD
jgi:hypothetical protein